ncbi:hypothetical protein AXX12_14995 [Anaerosporomusa subterranea]|uniref:Secreted protein n=1 Tax=Anaerosporomusa subterranea TaxID=1794912 RepID=A0A154BLM8_ANASB|nr:hypothetical protein [Anaerosporomusa subterranea]KYZ74887.1 hypothetical protein AXX12_14995 [Anaerosporomusa subterranea]MDF2501874.1 hypothetical protein [Anaerosporomusa subterranea]
MKKLALVATLAFVLTGFASTVFAGEGNYIQEKIIRDTEKRIVEKEKEAGKNQVQASDCCEISPQKENK